MPNVLLTGELSDEILISAHVCHPSLANDNLAGISVVTFLIKQLLKSKPRYSYRFIFIPGTIGAIAWLAVNEHKVAKSNTALLHLFWVIPDTLRIKGHEEAMPRSIRLQKWC